MDILWVDREKKYIYIYLHISCIYIYIYIHTYVYIYISRVYLYICIFKYIYIMYILLTILFREHVSNPWAIISDKNKGFEQQKMGFDQETGELTNNMKNINLWDFNWFIQQPTFRKLTSKHGLSPIYIIYLYKNAKWAASKQERDSGTF